MAILRVNLHSERQAETTVSGDKFRQLRHRIVPLLPTAHREPAESAAMRLCSTEVARSLLEQDMRSSPVTRLVLFPSPASQNIQHHINQDIRQTLSSTNDWQARATYFQACHQYPEHNLLSGDEKKEEESHNT